MKWLYGNGGLSCRNEQPDDTELMEGEIAFDHAATAEELAVAFPGYAPETPSPARDLAAEIDALKTDVATMAAQLAVFVQKQGS